MPHTKDTESIRLTMELTQSMWKEPQEVGDKLLDHTNVGYVVHLTHHMHTAILEARDNDDMVSMEIMRRGLMEIAAAVKEFLPTSIEYPDPDPRVEQHTDIRGAVESIFGPELARVVFG